MLLSNLTSDFCWIGCYMSTPARGSGSGARSESNGSRMDVEWAPIRPPVGVRYGGGRCTITGRMEVEWVAHSTTQCHSTWVGWCTLWGWPMYDTGSNGSGMGGPFDHPVPFDTSRVMYGSGPAGVRNDVEWKSNVWSVRPPRSIRHMCPNVRG